MIEVGDINDNPPSFSADVYYAGVSLTATKGSLVTQLRVSWIVLQHLYFKVNVINVFLLRATRKSVLTVHS